MKNYFVGSIIMKDLEQDIIARFDPDQEGWDKNEQEIIDKIKESYLKSDKVFLEEKKDEPHKKPVTEIIKDMRIVFFDVLEIVLKKENPIPYILSENKNQLSFCLIIVLTGVLLLLITNILF